MHRNRVTVNKYIVCLAEFSRTKADVDVLFRKVVRDSIRSISELELHLGKELMVDWYYYLSEG